MVRPTAVAVALALTASAPALAAPPAVNGAWVRPPLGAAGMGAVYLTVEGRGSPDTLLGASTPAAGSLALHRSEMRGGMMSMAPVSALPVPARGAVRLSPGGLHLMLMDPRRPLKPGDRIPVTLRFARAGAVTTQAQVRSTPP